MKSGGNLPSYCYLTPLEVSSFRKMLSSGHGLLSDLRLIQLFTISIYWRMGEARVLCGLMLSRFARLIYRASRFSLSSLGFGFFITP